jgi:hypothetical protein
MQIINVVMGSEIHFAKKITSSVFLYGIVYLFTLWRKYATFHEVRFFYKSIFRKKTNHGFSVPSSFH